MKKWLSCLITIFLFQVTVYCKDERETFVQLLSTDSTDMNAIASYPESVRNSLFEVCTQPQGIANIANIQKESQTQFRNIVGTYGKEEQQKIWNLTRYPGLINKLVSTGPLSSEALADLLKDYPGEVQQAGREYTTHHFELLKSIDALDANFILLFSDAIKAYSSIVQTSFRELLNTPELINLLNNNMRMAVNLGVIYQQNPAYIKQQFEALNLEQAQQKARDLEEWKQKMSANPEAEKELQEAAKEYAADNGYKQEEYYETDPTIIYRYIYTPYPYWCGYPTWYEYEWWYPYPYWYHWGFCYWHGSIIWHSPPSWFFIHWHFNRHPHFYRYPHITNVCFDYYHGHHRNEPKSSETVHRWYEQNNRVLPRDFISNTTNRIAVIKDLGKLDEDYHKENDTNHRTLDKSDFLYKNQSRYPALKPTLPEQTQPKDNQKMDEKNIPNRQVNKEPVSPLYRQPKQPQPNKPKQDIQLHPSYEPKQNIRTKPNIQPSPAPRPKQNPEPPVRYQPKPHIQPRPQVQPVPRQNNPVPHNQNPGKKRQ